MPVHSGGTYLHSRGDFSSYKKTFVRRLTAGANAETYPILKLRKHYWGHGVFRVITQKSYYDGYSYGEYMCFGHTRISHGAYTNIVTIQSGHAPSWSSITSVSGYEEGYATLSFTCPSYLIFIIVIEVLGSMAHNESSDDLHPGTGATNQYYIY